MSDIVYNKNGTPFDIDAIATDLNGKADVDLTNVNNSGTSLGASWTMPSSTYKTLTLGSTGTDYLMPANGWVCFAKRAGASNEWANITNRTNGYFQERTATYANNHVAFLVPVCKNDTVRLSYSLTGTTTSFRFYYAKGSESEAS